MNLNIISRVSRLAAIGAILLGSASCIDINEELGENLIPIDQKWDVYTPEPIALKDIRMQMSDSLSGYSTSRFTFGAISDGVLGTSVKSTSFTLVPISDTLDFGRNTVVKQFHFCAVKDTLSTVYDNQLRMLQNVYVSELKKPLDSTVLYTGAFTDEAIRKEFLDLENRITVGIPVYDGGDSLSFDFSKEWTENFIERLKTTADMDSMDFYIQSAPGIYITTDTPAGPGGRINMFKLPIGTDSYGYITGNYAQLKFTAEYDYSDEPVDTSFLFYFGPADFLEEKAASYPTQFAFNASSHETSETYSGEGVMATDKIYVEGGAGIKPVICASEIKDILDSLMAAENIIDPSEVVINKATIMLPFEASGEYTALEKYPTILSPTVRLRSADGKYVSYAGLTDASIESENQGDINRSLMNYAPDISHHVQEILRLDRDAEDFAKKIGNYDIWMLIMFSENATSESTTGYNEYQQNLLYNSYYNSMMYDPYGYGYGYGGYGGYGGYYGGYGGYGGYGYGSNYYNYMMMAAYASGYSGTDTGSYTVELDKDRFYSGVLNGPEAAGAKPQIKITFSAPKSAEAE